MRVRLQHEPVDLALLRSLLSSESNCRRGVLAGSVNQVTCNMEPQLALARFRHDSPACAGTSGR